ncbi:transglutaminase family protein [Yimella sp. cx-51]|uniref:transglutaminase-like domain-containing protein n=1 Tax=Yimella sp. cx-51 TaxID=2770551 RepID=UPI00165DB7ED|nr:transglutaminase-like domain-containing protein [Yimella sp. cx-51]MBC9955938.1 transglutaminase domain-containing protein [Yimella sp. cx-51]QTH37522.1 transglutaminase domain-containing protein [Yimella sp. cx-51]
MSLPLRRSQRRTHRIDAATGLPRTWPADLVCFALLMGIGVLAFGPVFGGSPGYRAAGGGVLLGAGIALLSAWRRWSVLGTTAVVVATYFLFGGLFALPTTATGGVLPTLVTLRRLALLTVDAWRDLLTVSTPASAFTGPTVVPYLSAVVCSVLSFSLAMRARWHLFALVPAAAFLIVGILWGTQHAPLAVWQGVAFVAVALCWNVIRSVLVREADEVAVFERASVRSGVVARVAAALVGLAVAMGVAYAATPAVVGDSRYVLRDHVVPPLDLRSYASPLTDFRYLERDLKQTPLVTVAGLAKGQRVQLAVLDAYDGIVYSVGGSSTNFVRIGERFDQQRSNGKRSVLDISISGYSGVWMPGGGTVEGVRFTGSDAEPRAAGLHYSPATGNLLTTAQVRSGARYQVDLLSRPLATDEALRSDQPLGGEIGDTNVPDAVSKLADDYTAKARAPIDQLRAIESTLRTTGFYSNGSDGKSRAGHTAERMGTMLELPQLIGDDEQYAVAMALMARSKGIPARVVMGFYADPDKALSGPITFTGNDVHVWVEVPFQKAGWVAFDPTPDRDRTPQVQTMSPQPQPKPRVLPPPIPPKDNAEPPAAVSDGKQAKKQKAAEPGFDWAGLVRTVAYVTGGLTMLVAPFVVVLALKRRRRKKRSHRARFSDRISGAWDEVMDAAIDLGLPRAKNETRQEAADRVTARFPEAGAVGFARSVDAHVFGGDEPDASTSDDSWETGAQVVASMRTTQSRWRRMRAAVSPRSLRSGRHSNRHTTRKPLMANAFRSVMPTGPIKEAP